MSATTERAKRALGDARRELRNAETSLSEGDHTGALKYFQEAGEYAAKAVLLALAVDYPRVHEVGRVLLEHRHRLPKWFAEDVEGYANAVDELARGRLRFRYPYERPPEEHSELARRMGPLVRAFVGRVDRLLSEEFSR